MDGSDDSRATYLTITAKFWHGLPRLSERVRVDADGTVRVWDVAAGNYTLVHSLSKSAIARIRRVARGGKSRY